MQIVKYQIIVLTSQGSSFFQAGEEFARSKMGDHNSYQSSASINKLDWKRVKEYSDLVNYYKGLIEIRKNFSAFRDPTTSAGNRIQWLNTPGTQQIAYSLTNNVSGEWSQVVCLFNASTNGATMNLPSGNWVIVANDTKAGVESLGTASGSVQLPGRSAMILVEKNSFDNTVIGKKGTVIVNHVNQNGDVIKTETKTGKEGTAYTTSPMNDEDYILVSTPSNANGKFTDGTITVTYQYKEDDTSRGTVTVKYVDKETGNEIATSESLRGKVGKTYTTTAKTISGYELIETPSNATGTYTEGNKVVTYYYKEKEIKCLTVHYYNTSWSTVNIYAYDESSGTAKQFTGAWPGTKMNSDGNGWWSYEVTEAESGQIIFNNGSSQEPSGVGSGGYNATGEVWVKDGKVLTEDPDGPSEGTVIVKYVDEAGNEIAASTTQKGTVGTSYTTTAKTISNYDLITIPNNATGKFTASTITVTYVYAEVGFDEAIVIVKYVDEAGNEIASSTTKNGFVGDSYTTTAKTISGYELVSTPSNASGKFTKEEITVTYKYKKITVVAPTINSFVANKQSPQVSGTQVTLTAKATGTGTLQYKFLVKDNTTGNWAVLRNYGTSNTYTWTTKATGNKTLYVDVKDSNGQVTRKSMSYTIKEIAKLVVSTFVADKKSPQVSGTEVTLSAAASGTGVLQYKFLVKDASGNWFVIRDYSILNSCTWKANKVGNKTLYVDVKDSNGQVTRKSMSYTVKAAAPTVTSFTANKQSPQVSGTEVVLTAKATGTGTLQYKFLVKDASGNWFVIQDYSVSNITVWKLSKVGNKTLYVDVKDSNGQVTRKSMSYTVK